MKGEVKLAHELLMQYPDLQGDMNTAIKYARVLLTIEEYRTKFNNNIDLLKQKLAELKYL